MKEVLEAKIEIGAGTLNTTTEKMLKLIKLNRKTVSYNVKIQINDYEKVKFFVS